jgi:hypothetical protein
MGCFVILGKMRCSQKDSFKVGLPFTFHRITYFSTTRLLKFSTTLLDKILFSLVICMILNYISHIKILITHT